jgi:PadR family transcriptional regulator, regulatory protein AphA
VAGRTAELSPTEAALLAFLAFGEKSGYDLSRAFARSIDIMWAPAKGHMYAILPRLVEQGWATRREVVQDKRPNKQVYRITNRGRSVLARWLERPPEPEAERNLLLVKVFFGELAGASTVLRHLRHRRAEAEALRTQMRELERGVEHLGERPLYPRLTRRYAVLWAEFMIRWTKEAEAAITAASEDGAASAPRRRPSAKT